MSGPPLEFLREPDRVRLALSPIRRQLLERLREPASATEVASELKLSRQRVGYHLRILEKAGLVELVEERPRRGCIERVMRARAGAFVIDPILTGAIGQASAGPRDQFAPERLVEVAAGVVRDVGGMQTAAGSRGKRVATFTLETEVSLVGPADVGHFAAALRQLLAKVVSEFDAPTVGHKYRVIVGGHPGPRESSKKKR